MRMSSATMDFFRPDEYLPLPTKDILSWIFDDPQYDQDKPVNETLSPPFPSTCWVISTLLNYIQIYINPHNASESISCNQARVLVRKLIAGLRANGFKNGDCLNVHSFNDVRVKCHTENSRTMLIECELDLLPHTLPCSDWCWRCLRGDESKLHPI
ncbi:hypothetical protein D8B26_006599 [Coccidioides posadasii str. Silveira]|uniref:uncharacterized protein n=1 Tax=Coccidioides posadasii (strain RMSCC 757 / Silveira) TaxID=443226 RepID=UPI001BF008DF|nr:hypothetical protein D8B26_006599 [Coccidioides posadasii str. Silveira]